MTTPAEAFDVIILGAGAAGLMCALTAGQRGRKVLLLDHADRVGAKILISGGGRCNFTNLHSAPDRFLSANTDFCKSALSRYTQADFISLVERHCIPYHEKTLGQLFCNGSARAIVTRDSSSEKESRVLAVASLRRASESTAKTSRAVAAYSAYSCRTLGSDGGQTAPGGKSSARRP